MHDIQFIFTSRYKVHQLNSEGSEKAAAPIRQSQEVQGDSSDVARGQLERNEGTCNRMSDSTFAPRQRY